MRVPRPGPQRRRDPLTQDAVVDAALAMLDTVGLDMLSMRRIARTLGTTAGALYWHVGSKDGLLDLVFDRIISEQPVPDPDPERWQEQVKEVARTMRATILRHRDVVRLSIGRMPMGPGALRYADRLVAVLRAGGLSPQLAVSAHRLLFSIVNGFAIDETGEGGHPPTDPPPPDPATARDYLAALPHDRFPHLAELAAHFVDGADERFELLLDLFVDGLAQRARSERAS
jgi:TetR/AcrR family transcriptional regulator, tetracycline repressor protein